MGQSVEWGSLGNPRSRGQSFQLSLLYVAIFWSQRNHLEANYG